MADIFVSHTSSDSDWAFWIGTELEALGHTPHIHEWEIEGGGDIYAWMEQRHEAADHVLCVVSDEYLKAPYSTLERNAALWQAADKRPNFVLFVVVKPCKLPTLWTISSAASCSASRRRRGAFDFANTSAARAAPAAV